MFLNKQVSLFVLIPRWTYTDYLQYLDGRIKTHADPKLPPPPHQVLEAEYSSLLKSSPRTALFLAKSGWKESGKHFLDIYHFYMVSLERRSIGRETLVRPGNSDPLPLSMILKCRLYIEDASWFKSRGLNSSLSRT